MIDKIVYMIDIIFCIHTPVQRLFEMLELIEVQINRSMELLPMGHRAAEGTEGRQEGTVRLRGTKGRRGDRGPQRGQRAAQGTECREVDRGP